MWVLGTFIFQSLQGDRKVAIVFGFFGKLSHASTQAYSESWVLQGALLKTSETLITAMGDLARQTNKNNQACAQEVGRLGLKHMYSSTIVQLDSSTAGPTNYWQYG